MTPEAPKWNARQDRVAVLLAAGMTRRVVAEKAQVGRRTIATWLRLPGFREHVATLRGRMLDRAAGSLSRATGKAVATLVKLLADPDSGVKLRASVAILDNAVKLRDRIDADARIAALEARALASEQTNGESWR